MHYLILLAIFVAFVYTGVRWQQERRRRLAVHNELSAQIGKRAVVTEQVEGAHGLVRINGEGYAACSSDGNPIGPRVLVEVTGVQRYRLAVSRIEGQGQLIDVDQMIDGEDGAG